MEKNRERLEGWRFLGDGALLFSRTFDVVESMLLAGHTRQKAFSFPISAG
jgi:hypothetical protein